MKRLAWIPLLVFVALMALALYGLTRSPEATVRSRQIGQPLPDFVLAPALPGKPGLTTADFRRGEPRLLNLFASWCVPCIAEAPQLLALRAAGARIDAVAVRDSAVTVRAFLDRHGDPFTAIGDDPGSRLQLAIGAAGVPETYVIDGRGRIRYQHAGNITAGDVPVLLRELERAR